MWRFPTNINRIITSFASCIVTFRSSNNSSSFVEIQSCVMKFHILKLSGSVFRRSTHLFVSCRSDIVWIVCTSRMTWSCVSVDHHGVVLSVSGYCTASSLSYLICIILILFSIIRSLIDWFVSPIPRIIHRTLRYLIWICLFYTSIRYIITRVNYCLI